MQDGLLSANAAPEILLALPAGLSRWRLYTGPAINGSTTFDDSVIGGPLEAGDYAMRLMQDDAYLVLATTPSRTALDGRLLRLWRFVDADRVLDHVENVVDGIVLCVIDVHE